MRPMSQVILVDQHNRPIGAADKLDAHIKGLPHRAFSIFIFQHTPQGTSLLLQKRCQSKYHSGGLWSNTCCSHPHPQEDFIACAQTRLQFEMGFRVPLKKVGLLHYIASCDNGLTENEWDYILTGYYHGQPISPHPDEVEDFCFEDIQILQKKITSLPEQYTAWLPKIIKTAVDSIQPFVTDH
jgi:isopentenyl-diphosphate delta-isomerase